MLSPQLKAYLDHAKGKRKENKKFIASLSRLKQLDDLIHTQHTEVFAETDCLQCANCCKTTSPIFRDVDIDRIARHLGMRPSELTSRYLHLDEDNDWVLNNAPCVFLRSDNTCSIYEVRPRACRDYPHTDRKNMAGILDLTYNNTLVCPAVARMVENLKKELNG